MTTAEKTHDSFMSNLKETYDRCYENPFWKTHDGEDFKILSCNILELVDITVDIAKFGKWTYSKQVGELLQDRYTPIIKTFWHDIRRDMGLASMYTKLDEAKRERMIRFVQGFLSAVRQMIDNVENPSVCIENIFGSTLKTDYYKGKDKEGWYCYNEVPRTNKEKVLGWYRRYLDRAYDKENIKDAIQRIENETSREWRFV